MLNKYGKFVTIVLVLVAIGFAANARAEILFSDNFNNAGTPEDTNGYCLNEGLNGRLSGSVLGEKPANYDWWAPAALSTDGYIRVNDAAAPLYGGDMLLMGANNGHNHAAIIQYDFSSQKIIDAGGFTVRFDMDPMSEGSTSSLKYYGGGVFIGAQDGTASNVTSGMLGRLDSKVELAVGFTDSKYTTATNAGAKTYTYSKAQKVGDSGAANWNTFDPNSPSDLIKMYTFELRVVLQPGGFADGTSAMATMWWGVQGTASESLVELDINGGLDGNAATWTWDDNASNYIGFFSYTNATSGISDHSVFDNVEIAIVPEPSTLALLATGLIGLLAYAWRKRK